MSSDRKALIIRLTSMEGCGPLSPRRAKATMEFHIAREIREKLHVLDELFSSTGNVILPNFQAVRNLAQKINEMVNAAVNPDKSIKAGDLNAMGLIDEILHYVAGLYREQIKPETFAEALGFLYEKQGKEDVDAMLLSFTEKFPPVDVYKFKLSEREWLSGNTEGVSNRVLALEEMLLLKLANDNPAFQPFINLFDDTSMREETAYLSAMENLDKFFDGMPAFGPDNQQLIAMLRSPMEAAPYSLPGQLDYIRRRWGLVVGKYLMRILKGSDFLKEEESKFFGGPGPSRVAVYDGMEHEYERFSTDRDWMPKVVMIAKSTLVWLAQLSRKYQRDIRSLDQIPDEEIDRLARYGFNSLWLIGLWERSSASARIKNICGNPEAAASAYSLYNYEIAGEVGGWNGLDDLRRRCSWRGIKVAADMVPNHTGIDSDWVRNRPNLFLQTDHSPYPGYSFNGENLSGDENIGIYLEDHYYEKTDASVVFKRVDFRNGETRYIYHGNDGTSMPWNDTAQIDFLNPEAREAVIQEILHVARNFPVIRFDAAMVLAKKHIRRLWFPEPGHGGAIPSRTEHSISREDFDAKIPLEFWREVVDRCALEVPDTLLLAEAFWMLEGYFVRTLGMHRVYNSAFMNMLKREENDKYRTTIKNTQEFDKDILKRFVNFMNNPDEDTAVAQFGKGDKYFGVCTMMITMPGLPMFGHGQIEGFGEKYGMEYRRDYWNETADEELVSRHEREIFPIMNKRYIFSEVGNFLLYDMFDPAGWVNENVFVYSNQAYGEKALVAYNNAFPSAGGWINYAASYAEKLPNGEKAQIRKKISDAFGLHSSDRHFMIFFEQRSGLWFIRSSKDICEKGLQLFLNGYQCQVFLDIHEVEDGVLAQYRTLHDKLSGAGVPDISAAMQDIFLKDLYDALAKLINAEILKAIDENLVPQKKRKASSSSEEKLSDKALDVKTLKMTPEELILSSKVWVEEFFKTAKEFLKGTSLWAAFDGYEGSTGKIEKAWEDFSLSMNLLFRVGAQNGKKMDSVKKLENTLESRGDMRRFYGEVSIAVIFLDLLKNILGSEASGADAVNLFEHWCLDRKLRNTFVDSGMPEEFSYRAVEFVKAVYSKEIHPGGMIKNEKAKDIFSGYASDNRFRNLISVNTYDNVQWFNKERFEEFLFILENVKTVPALYYSKADKDGSGRVKEASLTKRQEDVSGIIDEFSIAKNKSGYRFEELCSIIVPPVKMKEKVPKKEVKTKSSDKKKDNDSV